ncbi:MAG: hypothetical protein WC861_00560 [Candidatus Micrarchaeia archaeon]|jgi:hypothetical protein
MEKTTKRAMGGFFFAVMALAMLALVLMTVQVWVMSFEQSDYRASQRFKGEAVRSILTSLSDRTLADFANASAFYATYRLVNYTSDWNSGLGGTMVPSGDPDNPKTWMVNQTIFELMLNGESEPNAGRPVEYSSEENSSYTIRGWQGKLNAAANAMGFGINFSGVRNFSYRQIDAWTVGVSFDMDMNITDMEGTMRQNRAMHAESNFSISGFLDPMITRNDMGRTGGDWDLATKKQIFKLDEYNVPSDVAPVLKHDTISTGDGAGPEGNGWFFGPITSQTLDELPQSPGTFGASIDNLKQYVLVHSYNTTNSSLASIANSYGAVIVTTTPVPVRSVDANGCNVTTQTQCLNCMRKTEAGGPGCAETAWSTFSPGNNPVNVPVIVVNGWNTDNITSVARADVGNIDVVDHYVLIDNEYENRDHKREGYHRVWDITRLRDMAICGFYVKGEGPSFFQRMLAGAESIPNPQLGIEGFVVGRWAGGADDPEGDYAADLDSRLDWEFYDTDHGNDVKIKGMMGCKSKEMCAGTGANSNATTLGVGHFRLTGISATRYNVTGISSSNAAQHAPCE